MNWTVIIIETLVLTAAFTAMILIPLTKNPVWWIADYPEDIQEEYFKTHERIPSKFFTPSVLLKKGMALLIALILLLLVVWLAGAYDFWSALGVGYGIWLFIDWYDCFFLDWVLFANMKSVRLPGTEHMDEAYHQKKYHFIQSCWGMLIGLIPCLTGAGIYACILLVDIYKIYAFISIVSAPVISFSSKAVFSLSEINGLEYKTISKYGNIH